MVKSSRRAQEIKLTGKKEKISPSKSSRRRKIKRKEESKKLNRSKKNHSSTSSLMLKSTVTKMTIKTNKKTMKLNN
jgi:hypothetical protein